MNSNLPFERGNTYHEGNLAKLSDSSYEKAKFLLGQTFSVKNDGQADVGNDATETEVMVVRNASGDTLSGGVGIAYGVNPHEASGYASTGGYGHVVDDAYGTEAIEDGDMFYVVVRGPVRMATSEVAGTSGDSVGFGAVGVAVSPATAHVIGVVHGTQSTGLPAAGLVVNLGHPAGIGPMA